MYNLSATGERVYTLKKIADGKVTKSAHPARFSPDDKYSRHRVTLKKRYGLLLTQQSKYFFFPFHQGKIVILYFKDLMRLRKRFGEPDNVGENIDSGLKRASIGLCL